MPEPKAEAKPSTSEPIGVSAIVRLKTGFHVHLAGTLAIVVDQAPNGRDRYKVMVPGDPVSFAPHVSDLEVVQGVDPDGWWKRPRKDRYSEGVAAGRAQAAADIREYGERLRVSSWNPHTGVALGAIVDEAARIAEGAVPKGDA